MKKKVAYLSSFDQNLYLFRLSWMKALINEGYDVYAILPEGRFFDKFSEFGIKTIKISLGRGGLNPIKDLFSIFELYKILRKGQFDILHTFTIKPNIYGAIAGKLAGIPIIINHITGLGYIYIENNFKARILRILSSIFYKISFSFATRIIFQNADDLNELLFLFNKEKACVIRGTGVDAKFYSNPNGRSLDNKELKRLFSIAKDSVVITMIGRLLWHKGLGHFVEAADMLSKKYQHIIFLVVGWIDTDNPAAVPQEFISQFANNEHLRFIGERDDIKAILSVTDIYALPSYREGTPRTVLEAMAMAKPIVTTDVPGCRQTVDDGINGFLVPKQNTRALTQSLERLILNRELRQKMGKASREKVVREFSQDIVIRQILELYQELLSEEG